MKNTGIILLLLCLMTIHTGIAQNSETHKYEEKVKTLDSTLETLYAVISGEKGEERNWDLFQYLFHPEAKLIPTFIDKEKNTMLRMMTPEEYVQNSGPYLVENGFYEKEINRETQTYSHITQVFSTYESFRSKEDETPFMRGINSIQLFNNGERWFIVNVFWASETEADPLPERYLPKGE